MAAAVEASTVIAATPEQIWELMGDPHRYPEFAEETDHMVDVPAGPVSEGYVYREYGGIPPFKGESEWRVTVFEPHRRQVHVGDDGKMTFHLSIEIEPAGDGSRLTMRVTVHPRWFLAPVSALLWPLMMRRRAQAAADGTVANVKRILEVQA